MKILKLFTLSCCLSAINFSVAADYETIYSCGFEEGDDLSIWHFDSNYQDLYYIGAAAPYTGLKSLYISQDNGSTNTIHYQGGGIPSNYTSAADFNLTLPEGNYLLSFDYKLKTPQLLHLFIGKEKNDYANSLFSLINGIGSTNEWAPAIIPFTLEETAQWVSFLYNSFMLGEDEFSIEGAAIDNIEIKREKDETGASVNQTLLAEIKVYSIDRSIVVENATGAVTVYNTTGQVVAQGAGREFAVPQAGVYVVKAGETVKKVVIR
jgi:hypothetical protein